MVCPRSLIAAASFGRRVRALFRHPEYAWVLADEESQDGKELADYFKWMEGANSRMANASLSELDEKLDQILEESKEFGPFAHIVNQMLVTLFDLETQGISANSEEANAAVAAAYSAIENANEDDPFIAFYMLGKFYQAGRLTPPNVMARLDEQSLQQLQAAEAYTGEALRSFVETLDLTKERRKKIEELDY